MRTSPLVASCKRPQGKTTLGTSPVRSYGASGPRIQLGRRPEDARRLLEIEQREADAVHLAGDRVLHAVVDEEPAVLGPERRRSDPDAQRVPPCSVSRLHDLLGIAPTHEIGPSGREGSLRARRRTRSSGGGA